MTFWKSNFIKSYYYWGAILDTARKYRGAILDKARMHRGAILAVQSSLSQGAILGLDNIGWSDVMFWRIQQC